MSTKQTTNYRFKFSIVIAVYNAAEYLHDTVDSIINQDINFKESTQIILINDGSIDNSELICREYQELFPDNIYYLSKKNGGVSSARNAGLDLVQGKYVNFLDSDDKLSSNTLGLVGQFFDRHHKDIDFIAIKFIFFGAKEGSHPLNFKFKEDKVIDIHTDVDYVHLTCASTFIKSSLVTGRRFNEKVNYGEDTLFINEILLNEKGKYGALKDPTYYYRKRHDESSLTDSNTKSINWLIDTPNLVDKQLANLSISNFGEVIPFIQYLIMYSLQWRFKIPTLSQYSKKEISDHSKITLDLLSHVEDGVILNQKNIYREYKLHILGIKYNESVIDNVTFKGPRVYYRGNYLSTLNHHMLVVYDFITIKGATLHIEGYYKSFRFKGVRVLAFANGQTYNIEPVERVHPQKQSLDQTIYKRNQFKVSIPLNSDKSAIKFYALVEGRRYPLRTTYSHFSKIDSATAYAYRTIGKHTLIKRSNKLIVKPTYGAEQLKREAKYLLSLFATGRLSAIFYRLARHLIAPIYRGKDIWLICDRPISATDNASVLFKYIQNTPTLDVRNKKIYFLLDKKSQHYRDMRKIGPTLPFGGIRHKILILISSKVISSHFEDIIINPHKVNYHYLCNLYNFDFIYLEHGILAADISRLINRHTKDIKLITTASNAEADSILSNPDNYGYDRKNVKVTGQARFDELLNKQAKKVVVFAPTWRRYIAGRYSLGSRDYNENFKESTYFKFYSRLLQDEQLAKILKSNGYSGKLLLHPNHSEQYKDFPKDTYIKTLKPPHDYNTELAEAKLLVTDYSGVAFDFAYMKKPVIYTQFDRSNFYEKHSYTQGYYSFTKHGFGPVLNSYEDSVNAIIKAIKNEGKVEPKYERRIEKFFYKIDNKNSERVYQAILDMDKE